MPYVTGHVKTLKLQSNYFLTSPRRSTKKHAKDLGLLDQSVGRISRHNLKFYPYKLAKVQKLLPRDRGNSNGLLPKNIAQNAG